METNDSKKSTKKKGEGLCACDAAIVAIG